MTVKDIQNALPHLANIEPIGDPAFLFRVTTENGYVIKMPMYEETVYKTVGIIYPTDDLSTIQVLAISELPEDAVINGETGDEPVVTQ
jgi:hypothetical protein